MSGNEPKDSGNLKLLVMGGGAGTRLWPMSRVNRPKQLQPLVGNESSLQHMVGLLLEGFSPDDIFISTAKGYEKEVHEQLPQISADHIIGEPERRDTTAAIGYAAVHLAKRFPNCTMATIWGDHHVQERQKFVDSFKLASRIVNDTGLTVQVDVRPTFPSTNLGYIEIGKPILTEYGDDIYEYVRQVEKPDAATAKKFLASLDYLWHPGYRVWDINYLFELFKKFVPETYQALMNISDAIGTPNEDRVTKEEYGKMVKKSIDYTIFVHMGREGQAVVAADIGWNDIGTWEVLKDELADSKSDNATRGETVLLDTKDSLIYSGKGKVTAVIGLESVVIVDTEDALLVIDKDRAQDVKKIAEELKERGLDKYL